MGGKVYTSCIFCLQLDGPTTGRGYKCKFKAFFFEIRKKSMGNLTDFFIINIQRSLDCALFYCKVLR